MNKEGKAMKYYVKATIIIIICEIITALIADLINADRSESIIRFMIVYMCIDTIVRQLKDN